MLRSRWTASFAPNSSVSQVGVTGVNLRSMTRFSLSLGLIIASALGLTGSANANEFAPAAAQEALAPLPAVTELSIQPVRAGGRIEIRGRDGRQQLLVTARLQDGREVDVTRQVAFVAEPAGLLTIDSTGHALPLADGSGVLRSTLGDRAAVEIPFAVTGVSEQLPINFANQVVPIFTKFACNSGGCHGKATGQNGFKLSLLGFHPEDDYEFLVKEGRGRRLFPTSPDESLLLTKPTGRSPHGGGKRMDVGSHEYRLMRRWIEQGMPAGSSNDPHVVGIQCTPDRRIMDRRGEQQIIVTAIYSDGSTEDVTRSALFEPNDPEMADVSVTGLMKTHDLAGEVAIMARYQGQVATFRATVPLGQSIVDRPTVRNFIDSAVFAKLDVLGIPPSPICDDATFLRRVSIDLTGSLPKAEKVTAFLADPNPGKRDALIDELLDSAEYADYFTNKWNLVLRNRKRPNDQVEGTYAFYRWIWTTIYEDRPYNEFVAELLTASGSPTDNAAVAWYREVDQVNEQVEDVAQLFLGLRIQCARCHHHPFEKWSQDDYYGLAAFFSRVGRKNVPSGNTQLRDRRVFFVDDQGPAQARNERTGKMLAPTGLGSAALAVAPDEDPRTQLASWLVSRDNPFFARALVNRYWKHFFSRGIVEPEDDMRETNPPSNPELLQQLADHFANSGFSLKQLVRAICQSSTYQLSSLPNEYNARDKQNFSRYYPKRLTAEVLYDAFHQVTGTTENYAGMPAGTRAIQLPDSSVGPYFLKVFGQPQGDTACECERSQEANLAQSLHLLNSNEVQNKVAAGNGRTATLAADTNTPLEARVTELYRWVYARDPQADELKVAVDYLQRRADQPKLAFEDILWALVNTKEFLFNH